MCILATIIRVIHNDDLSLSLYIYIYIYIYRERERGNIIIIYT